MTANLYLLVTTQSVFIRATVLETGPFPHIFVHFQMSSSVTLGESVKENW